MTVSNPVCQCAECKARMQEQPEETQGPQERQVYRLPDASTEPVSGGIWQWISADETEVSQARVFVILDDGLVEHFSSKVYTLRRDCDATDTSPLESNAPFSVRNFTRESQNDRAVSAGIARHEMAKENLLNDTQRSPQDMFRELDKLRAKAVARYKQYEREQGALAQLQVQQAQDKAIYDAVERHKALLLAQQG